MSLSATTPNTTTRWQGLSGRRRGGLESQTRGWWVRLKFAIISLWWRNARSRGWQSATGAPKKAPPNATSDKYEYDRFASR